MHSSACSLGEGCGEGLARRAPSENPAKSSSILQWQTSTNSLGELPAKCVANTSRLGEKRSQHSLARRAISELPASIPVAKPLKLAGAKVEAWASPSEGFVRLANMPVWQRLFLWAQVPQVPHLGAR
jgi:hypothetical protein